MRNILFRFVCFLIAAMFAVSISAENTVVYSPSDTLIYSDVPEIVTISMSNQNNSHVDVKIKLKSSNSPYKILKIELANSNEIKGPILPFSYNVEAQDSSAKGIVLDIHLDFPYTTVFPEDEQLIVHTDKGIISTFTSSKTILKHNLSNLQTDFETKKKEEELRTLNFRIGLGIAITVIVIIVVIICVVVSQRFMRRQKEIEEMTLLIAHRSERNLELEKKVDALYGERLNALNMLCNEYFDKHGSEKMQLSFCNEIEKQILALSNKESVAALEKIVNSFLDDIMAKVRTQLPELNEKDLAFLTYLYAGFSPRAICIFTDIKIKNFYNRRSRLKERILSSDAPDKEYFVSKLNI